MQGGEELESMHLPHLLWALQVKKVVCKQCGEVDMSGVVCCVFVAFGTS